MKHVASISFGKDSLAMLLRLIEEKKPLDEVVFYDTGMEFDAIYAVRDMVLPLLKSKGIEYTELKPRRPFLYDMLEKPKRTGGCGYGWCGGPCRWGTAEKARVLDAHTAGAVKYVGIAYDEQNRLSSSYAVGKTFPLNEWGMAEKDCLDLCYSHGVLWMEDDIPLYSILDRVSCWCCANKNLTELRNMYLYLPRYWSKLQALQRQISMPMKRSRGGIFDFEERFKKEATA